MAETIDCVTTMLATFTASITALTNPFIPILASKGASLAYSASIDEISVLISFDSHVFSRSKEIFSRNGEEVFDFNLEKSLKVTR